MKLWKLMLMLFVLSTATVAFTACSEDEDEEQPAQAATSIVGTWVYTDYDDYNDGSVIVDTITFTASGTFTETISDSGVGYYDTLSGTYTYNGQTLTMNYPGEGTVTCMAIISNGVLNIDGDIYYRK